MRNFTFFILLNLILSIFYHAYGAIQASDDDVAVIIDASLNISNEFIITPNHTSHVRVTNFSTSITSVIVAAHSWYGNVTLSSNKHFLYGNSVTGTNVGLTFLIKEESSFKFWIKNQNSHNVSLLIYLSLHHGEDPVPGGCNMEFPVEIAPYLLLLNHKIDTVMEFQHANIGSHTGNMPPCGQAINHISYDIFVTYLYDNENNSKDKYFEGLRRMSTVESIKKESKYVKNSITHPVTKVVFFRYPKISAIYNVIAKYTIDSIIHEAAYVPSAIHSCTTGVEYLECGFPISSRTQPVLIIMSMFGIFLALFGHTCFTASSFVIGFHIFFFIGFILISKYDTSSSDQTELLIAVIAAVLGGILCALIWMFFQLPVISVIPVGFTSGLLLSAVILITPLGNLNIFMHNKVYWLFICGVALLITIFSVLSPKMMNIINTSFVGSYGTLLIFDYLLESNLLYVVINVIKKAIGSPEIFSASNVFPFGYKDKTMFALWGLLVVLSVVIQLHVNRKEPKFHKSCCMPQSLFYLLSFPQRNIQSTHTQCIASTQQDFSHPLLEENQPNYQTFINPEITHHDAATSSYEGVAKENC